MRKEHKDICLDCFWMHHSRDDWYVGRCERTGEKITYINNYDTCKDYMAFDSFEEEMEEEIEEEEEGSDYYCDENGYLVDDYTDDCRVDI